jgi:hypothetical protein
MGYPVGRLLAALADRILHNPDLIEAKSPEWGTPEQDQPPYLDTQLLISLFERREEGWNLRGAAF